MGIYSPTREWEIIPAESLSRTLTAEQPQARIMVFAALTWRRSLVNILAGDRKAPGCLAIAFSEPDRPAHRGSYRCGSLPGGCTKGPRSAKTSSRMRLRQVISIGAWVQQEGYNAGRPPLQVPVTLVADGQMVAQALRNTVTPYPSSALFELEQED